MKNIYPVLTDMGQHPQMYSITTMGELKAFVDGYRFGVEKGDSVPSEVPPFRQFSEWLVRKLKRGDTSFGWWQLIQWNDTDEATAIGDFGTLITEFAKRTPTTVADAQIDCGRHVPTGRLQLGVKTSHGYFDLTSVLPVSARITKYMTDDGVYLEYIYDLIEHERYCPSVSTAKRDALADFQIDESDWENQQ